MRKVILCVVLMSILICQFYIGLSSAYEVKPEIKSSPISQVPNGIYTLHAPIAIYDNNGFTPTNGVTHGNGTSNNPYIIEGWEINPGPAGDIDPGVPGISISGTNKSFIIQNCYIHTVCNSPYDFPATGIGLIHTNNWIIRSNYISNNSGGIDISDSSSNENVSNIISNNTCIWNSGGIDIKFSDKNTIMNNTFVGNGVGFLCDRSNANIFIYNNITKNQCGLAMYAPCSKNHIHHNNFDHNIKNQTSDNLGNNFWNTSTEGNYWSDWTSPDFNHDGIVDNPYNITFNGSIQDHFPLVNPVNNSAPIVKVPEPVAEPLMVMLVIIPITILLRRKK